jgi:peptidoglycan/xylan/chitin deacetylase (PgdA/CDA1 family)
VAYITIDDGPSREVTPGILDLLQQEGIKATFFVLPHDGMRDLYRRIIDEGHEIGNHSYTHVYSKLYNSKDIDAFKDDVQLAQGFILDNFGYSTTSFRFPGGAMGRKSSIIEPRREFIEELGYRDFDWNVETGDSNPKKTDKSPEALAQRVLDNTRNREQLIVLMHDTKSKLTTLEALPLIIAGLREQGYSFDILQNY